MSCSRIQDTSTVSVRTRILHIGHCNCVNIVFALYSTNADEMLKISVTNKHQITLLLRLIWLLTFVKYSPCLSVFCKDNSSFFSSQQTTLKLDSLSKSTPTLFWDWMDKSVIPGLYGDTYYNGKPMHWRHSRFLSDWNSYRVGPARLRQLRVKPGNSNVVYLV